jgi:hypothetical protein
MVAEDLVEALQTYTVRFFFLVVTNLCATPDALDREGLFSFFSSLIHRQFLFHKK